LTFKEEPKEQTTIFIPMPIFIALFFAFFAQSLFASEPQEFTAQYQINYGTIRLGEANYQLNRVGENSFHFDFSSDLSFLIFSVERVVKSKLIYEEPYLLPDYYSHHRKGTGKDYFEEVRFERSQNIIHSSYSDQNIELDYEKDIVDGLTVQLQLMLDLQRGVERPKYKILDENRVREREFSYVGQETITIENEDCHTVVYEVVRDNNRRKTQMWFSPERNFLPVQMVHFSKGKKKFNAFLTHYTNLEEPGTENH
jgi:hypothetical protein